MNKIKGRRKKPHWAPSVLGSRRKVRFTLVPARAVPDEHTHHDSCSMQTCRYPEMYYRRPVQGRSPCTEQF